MTKRVLSPKHKRLSQEFIDSRKEEVFKMAQIGCTTKEISLVLSCGEEAVKIRFNNELLEGRSHLRKALRRAQLESAINEKNTTMLIWLGKNYLGQREPKHEVAHSGGINVERVLFGTGKKVIDISETA